MNFRDFNRALLVAGLHFVVSYSAKLIASLLLTQGINPPWNPTVFITMAFFAATQFAVFYPVGLALAYFPAKAVFLTTTNFGLNSAPWAMVFGAILGLLFLPVCAIVAMFNSEPGDPSFVDRCIECGPSMMIAGIGGGFSFWRVVSRRSQLVSP